MRRRLAIALACSLPAPAWPAAAGAATCSQQDRVDRLIAFFDGWSHGDLTAMKLDRPDDTGPFGTTLPKRAHPWRRERQRPVSRRLASVRAWLRRRVAAGDRVTLLRVQ